MQDVAAIGLFALRGVLCALAAVFLSASAADSADLSIASSFFSSPTTIEQAQGSLGELRVDGELGGFSALGARDPAAVGGEAREIERGRLGVGLLWRSGA